MVNHYRAEDRSRLREHTGTVTLDVSEADFTAWQDALTITLPTGNALRDVFVIFDLADATTGFAAVHTSETIQFAPAHDVDAFNVDQEKATTAISGTNAAASQVSLHVPACADGGLKFKVKLSAEAGDTTIPFKLFYRSPITATVTAAS